MIVNQAGYPRWGNTQSSAYISFNLQTWAVYFVCVILVSTLAPLINIRPSLAWGLLPIFAIMLWRVGEPPVLFFCVAFQWLQVSTKIFDANIRGLTLADYYSGWSINDATMLSLVGLVVLSIGIRVALSNFHRTMSLNMAREAATLSPARIWYAYLIILFVSFFGNSYVWLVPRLSQILFMALNFKWVLFFALAVVVVSGRRNYGLLLAAFSIELVTGFMGFFSGYKQVFFILAIVFMTFIRGTSGRMIGRLIVVGLVVGYLSIIWSAVKQEYRDYVSQESGKQVVLVSAKESLTKLFELYSALDQATFERGFESMAKRIAYVDYFARVLETVPSEVPHAEGAIWGGAISHILTPRLLFPDKGRLVSDTEITEIYTGYRLIEQGGRQTNIPLGYFAESYIDFGPLFMFLPILIVGIAWGLIYRYFLSTSNELIFGYSLAVAVLISASTFEIGATKMIGGVLMGFIVMALLQKWIVPPLHRIFEHS